MIITNQKLEALRKLYLEIDLLTDAVSEAIKEAKKFQGNTMLVKRADGKEVEISEKTAWEEIRLLGINTECYEIMKAKYPKVFELGDQQRRKAKELNDFTMSAFGLVSDQVRLGDIFQVVEAMVDYKLGKNPADNETGVKGS